MDAPARIAADGVGHAYPGGVEALGEVSLAVAPGELVAVIGPSGCGKSTLLSILAGLIAPARGRVLVDGQAPEPLLGTVALMPQDDLLMPWRTVVDNAALGLEVAGNPREEARMTARRELRRFGLEGFERARPYELSGGMRQRAALLRTFLTGHDVLLLDEPLASLDALTRREMRGWLQDVLAADGKTVALVTHDVEDAVYLADRVIVLSPRPGRVVAEVVVPLARPRRLDVIESPEFAALRRALLEPLGAAA